MVPSMAHRWAIDGPWQKGRRTIDGPSMGMRWSIDGPWMGCPGIPTRVQKMHKSDHFFCISCLKKIERLQKKTICTRKMTQLPILEHLDFILLECLICIMSIV